MTRSRVSEPKPTLNVSISPHLYKRLKEEIGDRKVSGFVEKAIAKELGENDNNLEREQRKFVKKLIADYKRAGSSKNLQKEENIWEEIVGEWLDE